MIDWFVRNILAPPWAVKERSPYLRVAARLERERHLSADERLHRQWMELRSIVTHAFAKSPFYRRRFESVGFVPDDLRSWEDLCRLPVLTKQDVREHGTELVARSHDPESLHRKRTSGSTGVSLHVLVDEACNQWRRGVVLYRDRWTGWNLGEIRAAVWGNPPQPRLRQKIRNALLERTFYLDTLRMDEAMMRHFAALVLAKRPSLLWGHAHSLYLLACFWETQSYPRPELKGVLSTAMVLHAYERERIETVFGAPLFDRYGCEEVSLIASECEAHEGLHVNSDSLVVEVDRRDGEPAGHVLVTDLRNRGMPFIRYEVGDRALWHDRPCSCGRTYPLLRGVMGRVADYLVTPHGELVSGISLTENFATLIAGVQQVQIVQDERTHLLIRVVPGAEFEAQGRQETAELVRQRFGPEMTFEIELVERIPQEPSGKYRFTICRLGPSIGPN